MYHLLEKYPFARVDHDAEYKNCSFYCEKCKTAINGKLKRDLERHAAAHTIDVEKKFQSDLFELFMACKY